jgi:hypothetical protein
MQDEIEILQGDTSGEVEPAETEERYCELVSCIHGKRKA